MKMMLDSSQTIRRLFLGGVILKGIDGVLELIGGTFLLFVSNANVNRLLQFLVREELAEDPKDFIANYISRFGQHLSLNSKIFASVYLVGHGLVKIVLVANLLRNRSWAYPVTIATLSIFIGYHLFRLTQQFSMTLTVFTVFDLMIVGLIWLERRSHRKGGGYEPSPVP